MIELIRVEGNELAKQLHNIGLNRVFVKAVDAKLSGELVLFEGMHRIVLSVDKVNYQCLGGAALRVRFKPLPQVLSNRPQCKDLDTAKILETVLNKRRWPHITEYREWGAILTGQFGRLIQRKECHLINRGYISLTGFTPQLTYKGHRRLQQLKDQNA